MMVRGYNIQRLPLGAYFNLLRNIDKLPSTLAFELSGGDSNSVIAMVQKIAVIAPDIIIDIIASATGETKEKINNDRDLGIDGLVEVLVAIWDVNELTKQFESAKKKLPAVSKYLGMGYSTE